MQSYTTQSHQRNYQGNVVMPQKQNRPTKRHKILTGITTTVMALAVAITGGLLGATTIHNHQLKNEVQTLRIQSAEVSAETTQTQTQAPIDENQQPMTLEIHPNAENEPVTEVKDNAKQKQTRRHYPKRRVKPQHN